MTKDKEKKDRKEGFSSRITNSILSISFSGIFWYICNSIFFPSSTRSTVDVPMENIEAVPVDKKDFSTQTKDSTTQTDEKILIDANTSTSNGEVSLDPLGVLEKVKDFFENTIGDKSVFKIEQSPVVAPTSRRSRGRIDPVEEIQPAIEEDSTISNNTDWKKREWVFSEDPNGFFDPNVSYEKY